VVLTTSSPAPAHVLPDNLQLAAEASLFEMVAEYERRLIIESLERFGYSQTDAAEALRIPLLRHPPVHFTTLQHMPPG
jgi:DNA-binding NtrC family response regulator